MTHDPNWTIDNDKQSVHVGINTRFWMARQNSQLPVRILMGREHTRLFMREKGWLVLPKGPYLYGSKGQEVPVVFNVPDVYGIALETVPKPPKEKKKASSKGRSKIDE